jgi:hypothetical protein
MSNPALPADERERLVRELMIVRRKVGTTRRAAAEDGARRPRPGEARPGRTRPPMVNDGVPDLNRHMARPTTYANWYSGVGE